MTKIHGSVFMVLGVFISVLSWFLNYGKLKFFFFFGIIFFIYGLGKILIRKEPHNLDRVMKAPSAQANLNNAQHQAHHYKKCVRCGKIMHHSENYCSLCGYRLV